MRITCPNCLAQYEVDTKLLPADGREVQCSACNHIWFQPAGPAKPRPPRPRNTEDNAPLSSGIRMTSKEPPALAEPAAPRNLPVISPTAPDNKDGSAQPTPPTRAQPAARKLDPAVADVLRQEAEFEAAQRQREASGGLDIQPELGLMGGPWPTQAKATPPDPMRDTAPKIVSREGVSAADGAHPAQNFPDIDDISASLEPLSETRKHPDGAEFSLPETASQRQRSFLRGLAIPLLTAALLVGLYLAAPLLAQLAPIVEPALGAYTGMVDNLRVALVSMIPGNGN